MVTVTADEIEYFPPNRKPVISSPNPPSGTYDISLSLSELSFKIEDEDNDRMSYQVTTEPDIGSGTGNNKNSGYYSISIGGLEPFKRYRWTVEVSDGKDTTIKEFSFVTVDQPLDPFNPYSEGWQYRKKITIDHNKVDGNLKDFPILISVIDSDLRNKAQNDGDDILFMDGTGVANKLFHEIEEYHGSSGKLIAWVNIPSLSSTTDTKLYMYYGNPGCNSQQFPEKVWDSNYLAVFHMNDVDNEITDSTLNNNDFSESGDPLYLQNGKIGDGIKGDGDNDYFTNTMMDLSSLSEMTIELWFNIGNIDHLHHSFLFSSKYSTYEDIRFAFRKQESGMGFQTVWDDGTIEGGCDYIHVWNLGDWKYVVGSIKNNDKAIQYVDGAQTIVDNSVNFDFMGLDNIHNIGRRSLGINRCYYDGILDEFRLSNIARSSDWVLTSYNNQNNPSSFLSLGPEETGP